MLSRPLITAFCKAFRLGDKVEFDEEVDSVDGTVERP
jgi:hypothetical protein